MKAKQTKPGRSGRGNNVGGSSLNQSGFGGGSHAQKKGSLNMKGFGNGGGHYGKGFESKPIPKSEQ